MLPSASFRVSFADCAGHSIHVVHLQIDNIVSCSFHLTRNLPTPHMPVVRFVINIFLDKKAEVLRFCSKPVYMRDIGLRDFIFS